MSQSVNISFWGRLRLGYKLAIIPLVFILAISGILYYTVVTIQKRQTDSQVIDIAGRQRMLNKDYVNNVILESQGFEADHQYPREILEQSLAALQRGGAVVKTLMREERAILPPAPTEEIVTSLSEQKQVLTRLGEVGDRLLVTPESDPDYLAHLDQLLKVSTELHFKINECVKLFSEHSQANISAMIGFEIMVGLLVGILGIFLSWLVARSILNPLGRVVHTAQKISEGDLRLQKLDISSSDEVGQLAEVFNGMMDTLRDMAVQTRSATENLNGAAAEILATVKEQAASTSQQASSVQETTTTMEEMNRSGSQISERSQQVATAAESTATVSNTGLSAVQEMVMGMDGIREQAEAVAENIVSLSEKTQAVGQIIASVNDIAEQSNLLALNAAIEAAAAGEQGRSFAVVAGEIKNLADQAKEFTRQVKSILEEIQRGINSSVMLTEEAVKRVGSGKEKSEIAEETIRKMAESIQESIQAFQQIVGATNQQQIGFEQVTQALKDINQATEQTATGTGQMETAVANLNSLGQQLQKAVERYQV